MFVYIYSESTPGEGRMLVVIPITRLLKAKFNFPPKTFMIFLTRTWDFFTNIYLAFHGLNSIKLGCNIQKPVSAFFTCTREGFLTESTDFRKK